MQPPQPKLTGIISTDDAALLGAILPCVGVALWVGNAFFGFPPSWRRDAVQQDDPIFLMIAAGAVILGIALLTFRWRVFSALFDSDRKRGREGRRGEFSPLSCSEQSEGRRVPISTHEEPGSPRP